MEGLHNYSTNARDSEEAEWFNWRLFLSYAGPGFLMCIAFLDPGNLEADLQQGAYCGMSLLWVLLLSHVAGFFIQLLSARLGNVTGKNLAQVCRDSMPWPMAMLVYMMTEVAIIGADIQEVLGTAVAWQILLGVDLWIGCVFTGFDAFMLLGAGHFGTRKLEAVVMVLLGAMTLCFGLNFLQDPPTGKEIARGLIPSMPHYSLRVAIGTVGAVIMPHNVHLHSAVVLSRSIDRRNPRQVQTANKYCAIDAGMALFVCFLINMAVVGCYAQHFFSPTCATAPVTSACFSPSTKRATFGTYGSCSINGNQGVCTEIGLRSAGDGLQETLGPTTRHLWAVGLLAAGLSSTMVTTYAGQFVMEGFLDLQVSQTVRVVITRCVALVPAVAVALSSSQSAAFADSVGQWLNVFQAIQLPFALLPVLLLTDSPVMMGSFANSWLLSAICWTVAAVIFVANGWLVGSLLTKADALHAHTVLLWILASIAGVAYCVTLAGVVKCLPNKAKTEASSAVASTALAVQSRGQTNYGSSQA